MADAKRTSTGHELSDSQWLDAHFEVARAEYEAALRHVGVRPGWTALDAGCGNGGFLPTLSELVGPSGGLVALDLAPENVALVEARICEGALPHSVTAKVGSILALPFGEDTFDLVWCANVAQYLTDAEFAQALAEFRRVSKPGATIAVKEYDCVLMDMQPMDDDYVGRLWAARRARSSGGALGPWCGSSLGSRFQRAGLGDISRKGWLVERWAAFATHARLHRRLFAALGRLVRAKRPADQGRRVLAKPRGGSQPAARRPRFLLPGILRRNLQVGRQGQSEPR